MQRRPDWNAPETSESLNQDRYYQSSRAIGRLFRAIDLPAVDSIRRVQRDQLNRIRLGQSANPEEVTANFHAAEPVEEDELTLAVFERVSAFIAVGRHEDAVIIELWELFQQYASQLQSVCADHTLSPLHLSKTLKHPLIQNQQPATAASWLLDLHSHRHDQGT